MVGWMRGPVWRTRAVSVMHAEKLLTQRAQRKSAKVRHGSSSGLENFGGVLGEVGDDEVGAGAADAEEAFEYGAFWLKPAALKGGLQHRVFAGDLVGAEGHVEALARVADDVEVRHGGLHEDHVR